MRNSPFTSPFKQFFNEKTRVGSFDSLDVFFQYPLTISSYDLSLVPDDLNYVRSNKITFCVLEKKAFNQMFYRHFQ